MRRIEDGYTLKTDLVTFLIGSAKRHSLTGADRRDEFDRYNRLISEGIGQYCTQPSNCKLLKAIRPTES